MPPHMEAKYYPFAPLFISEMEESLLHFSPPKLAFSSLCKSQFGHLSILLRRKFCMYWVYNITVLS